MERRPSRPEVIAAPRGARECPYNAYVRIVSGYAAPDGLQGWLPVRASHIAHVRVVARSASRVLLSRTARPRSGRISAESEVIVNSRICALVLPLGVVAQPVSTQLSQPNEEGVVMDSCTTTRDVEANERFWESLGGEAPSFGQLVVMKFPDVLVFLSQGEPEGGS